LAGLMAVPLYARSVAAVIGGLLVLAAWNSVLEMLVVPRPGGGRLPAGWPAA
jgi:hypothetical protein